MAERFCVDVTQYAATDIDHCIANHHLYFFVQAFRVLDIFMGLAHPKTLIYLILFPEKRLKRNIFARNFCFSN